MAIRQNDEEAQGTSKRAAGAHEVDREQQAPQVVPVPVGIGAGLGERSVDAFVVDRAERAPVGPLVLAGR